MTLQILIPHYKEDEKTIGMLLASLKRQTCQDFEVIIANDGNDVILSDEFLSKFPFKITYLIKEHSGISDTRNYLLDCSTSAYIMFCDADDMFFRKDGIKWINSQENGFDIMSTAFLSQKGSHYLKMEKDGTFVHSKIFRRQFLIDNNIRFREDVKYHEDSYFVSLAFCCAKKINYCNDAVFYLYVENSKSVTHQKKFMEETFDIYVKSKTYLLEELKARDKERYAYICMATVPYDAWYYWRGLTNSKKRAVKRYFKQYEYMWNELLIEDKNEIEKTACERYGVDHIDIDKFVEEQLL